MREAARDLAVAVEVGEVVGARHDRQIPGPALGGAADLDELQPIARGVERLEVGDRLVVSRQVVVGAGLEAEHRLGRREPRLRRRAGRGLERRRSGPQPRDQHDHRRSLRQTAHPAELQPIHDGQCTDTGDLSPFGANLSPFERRLVRSERVTLNGRTFPERPRVRSVNEPASVP